ncbi:MAG: LysM peptidoglycan-binding domain-containing protein, partial [Chloroflexi bacterium]|nr:LysM peptidoglycan-binding domain-containing protein [Chloroflexota bacterium]
FGEGETIALGAQTHFAILELYRSPIVRGLMVSLALYQGKTVVRLPHWRPEGMRVAIETRIATVEASGTVFQCDVLDKDRIWVAVQEGKVTVSMGEQSLTLQAGQAVEARLGQPLVAVGAPILPTPSRAPTALTQPPSATPAATPTLTDLQKTLFPPARTPTRPGDDRLYYTVQPGDTLYSIAQRYGLSWEALWEANKASLPRPEDLRAGQKLLIPRASP